MRLKEIPVILGVDRVRIYRDNKMLSTEWIGGARINSFFREDTLVPYVDCEIDYLEMTTSESSEIIVCEIWLKSENS